MSQLPLHLTSNTAINILKKKNDDHKKAEADKIKQAKEREKKRLKNLKAQKMKKTAQEERQRQ